MLRTALNCDVGYNNANIPIVITLVWFPLKNEPLLNEHFIQTNTRASVRDISRKMTSLRREWTRILRSEPA